uniref:4Fe-4S cluster-binding domain-containing protein n=1 Tax=Herbidospora sakaeratensis TaxID=564415 RepID=UPI0034E2A545
MTALGYGSRLDVWAQECPLTCRGCVSQNNLESREWSHHRSDRTGDALDVGAESLTVNGGEFSNRRPHSPLPSASPMSPERAGKPTSSSTSAMSRTHSTSPTAVPCACRRGEHRPVQDPPTSSGANQPTKP